MKMGAYDYASKPLDSGQRRAVFISSRLPVLAEKGKKAEPFVAVP
jgi:hypothetical protein